MNTISENSAPGLGSAITSKRTAAESGGQPTVTFGDTLKHFINDVNSLQAEAGKAVQDFSSGEAVEVHDVMVAAEKARTSFDLLLEVRNKTIDAYRELMRIPV
ncbi:MAG: flagellar hook-basal body complex protein FliE [Acidobacteriota bacterium]